MPREAEQLSDKLHERPDARRLRIEARRAKPRARRLWKPLIDADIKGSAGDIVAHPEAAAPPPIDLIGQPINRIRCKSKGLADIAHGAAAAIADDLADKRRPVAPILCVDMLTDLLAPLVLEIDVDVGRLVPFAADEALEQDVDSIGIDRRDPEGIADRTVGGGTAALAKDAARPGERDDVMNGQEVRCIAKIVDDGEFMLELTRDLRRDAARVPLPRSAPDQSTQVLHRRHPLRHHLVGILVTKFFEREGGGAVKDSPGRLECVGTIRISPHDVGHRTQAAFGVQRDLARCPIDAHAVPDARERVKQRLAHECVHADVARGDNRHIKYVGQHA